MPRPLAMLLFLCVALSILGGMHFYIWARLVRDAALPPTARAVATWTIVGLGVSLPLSFLLYRALPLAAARVVLWPVYTWMGFMILLVVGLAGLDLLRVAASCVAREGLGDPERRRYLARAMSALAAAGAGTVGTLGIFTAHRPRVRTIEIKVERLPASLDGLSIAQITDLHVGPTLGRAWLAEVVAHVNALDADIVAITGDLADGTPDALAADVAPLATLRSRHGAYFVTGNHEYYARDGAVGADEWLAHLAGLGVRALRNERVAIGELDLAGVDDYNAAQFGHGHGADLPRALDGRDRSRPCVLLAHQPRACHEAARLGVDVQLSGHTHAGQIWPWNYFVRLQQPYVAGLWREGPTQVYVSSGTGYWGPPMRVGTTPEITKVVLRRG